MEIKPLLSASFEKASQRCARVRKVFVGLGTLSRAALRSNDSSNSAGARCTAS